MGDPVSLVSAGVVSAGESVDRHALTMEKYAGSFVLKDCFLASSGVDRKLRLVNQLLWLRSLGRALPRD